MDYSGALYSITPLIGATSYQWTVPPGAVITSGQNTPSITVTYAITSGKVKVTAGNNCGNTTTKTLTITLNSCRVADEVLVTEGLTVFPNPTSDNLVLEFENSIRGPFQIMITDAIGKLVLLQEFNGGDGQTQFSLGLNTLPAGLIGLRQKVKRC